ncbi:D-2-hydroxyacid dehydrogenase [Enterococcus hulanensis]|uniref:D-2-hydroxyacid dehydrogenase n=2 Tax=Enterococcus hulanensis TaxID=2559929 RepID=A0ABU3EYH8_9ENTE|nr:D-2-hydroxyacid dehydrogenase [Enterococcus hulanensis]MDT2599915.1 D-2-hydroxyacid dehydrogenase [Enterococcus hulanensis]MDT2609989.1 D-2-hydroxyacid dehydrogenase [Enterococcus hulanensis]MDT2617796.1 D-2-hydroxyacid dehydrogenase [Enterococcus hulanensis]MDT2630620.1 D-2-hydroxyacid dehydrogenase [Enterococcus hulanensis]MDT2656361.1 D-2-hydroxyacid dehydrogenase [Enterococcus hulanensis]
MKIVVLDGHALNPGDLSWQGFEAYGEVVVYDRTSYTNKQEIIERIGSAEAILTNKTPIDEEVLAAVPQLKYIGVVATGYNVVDIAAARKRGIPVTNIPAYGTDAVAQSTFALLLEIANQVGVHNQSVHQGDWQNSIDFTYWKTPLMELRGKTIGLIGYGEIAQATATIAHAFNMQVIYWNHRAKEAQAEWAQQVSLEELYHQSDVISLHVPQTAETEQMINQEAIQQMKDGVILLNTARGGLLDEAAVAEALNAGKIYAAGVDVVSKEPMAADNPLLKAKNCFITPHIAWAPVETRERLMGIAVDNFAAFIHGTEKNVVN